MSDAVLITTIICVTLIAIFAICAIFGGKDK